MKTDLGKRAASCFDASALEQIRQEALRHHKGLRQAALGEKAFRAKMELAKDATTFLVLAQTIAEFQASAEGDKK